MLGFSIIVLNSNYFNTLLFLQRKIKKRARWKTDIFLLFKLFYIPLRSQSANDSCVERDFLMAR